MNTILVPIMASRLMLSLKKATTGPDMSWSLRTMSETGGAAAFGTIHFASCTIGGPHEVSEAPTPPNAGDIELESIPRVPRDRR